MRPSDPDQFDDGEWLERHLLAGDDTQADAELQRFRATHSRLVRVTDEVIARLRGRLYDGSARLEEGLAAAKRGRPLAPETPADSRRTPARGTPFDGVSYAAPRRSVWSTARRVALGVVVLALGGAAGMWYTHRAPSAGAETMRTYATVSGQQATVTLDDGTRVALGPATTMRVRSGGAVRGMDVAVDGQALFTVTHRASAPFVVRAGRALTRVLGTTFMVRRYASDSVARVLVFQGRVALADTNTIPPSTSRAVLDAGGAGVVSDSGEVRVWSNATRAADTAWTSGRLDFRQAPVSDVLAELSRAYGVEIRVTDPTLDARKVTFSAHVNNQSLQSVLEALAAAVDAHVARTGRVITLVPGAASSASKLKRSPSYLTSESQHGR